MNFQGSEDQINNMMAEIEHDYGYENVRILSRYHNVRENSDDSYSIRVFAIPFLLEKFEALSKSMQNSP